MAYEATYTNGEGVTVSGPGWVVESWKRSEHEAAERDRQWVRQMRAMGVKAGHPDDGWVQRDRNSIHLCYPVFNDNPQVGDLIGLRSWPRGETRIVRVIRIQPWALNMFPQYGPMVDYYFEEMDGYD